MSNDKRAVDAIPVLLSRQRYPLDRCGFSLVELIVVMVILSALVLISLPLYNDAKDRAKTGSCMVEIRDMEKLIAAYAIDHSSYPPSLSDIGRGNTLDPWGNPYVYGPPTRKDFDFVNTDYDLYSKGRNGQSVQDITDDSSKDDVIRAADGIFVGTVAHYLGQ